MKRQEVYKLIDGERAYQDSMGPERRAREGTTPEHQVGEYITMLATYQRKLEDAWTLNAGSEKALDVMRKVAGIAVHCMEEHGAPPRSLNG